ncbi:hypothetical protein [Nitrosomonas sp.]
MCRNFHYPNRRNNENAYQMARECQFSG